MIVKIEVGHVLAKQSRKGQKSDSSAQVLCTAREGPVLNEDRDGCNDCKTVSAALVELSSLLSTTYWR